MSVSLRTYLISLVLIGFPSLRPFTMDAAATPQPIVSQHAENPFRLGAQRNASNATSAALFDKIAALDAATWIVPNNADSAHSLARQLGMSQIELEIGFVMRDADGAKRLKGNMSFGSYWSKMGSLGTGFAPLIQRARDYSAASDGKFAGMIFWRTRPSSAPFVLARGADGPAQIGKADSAVRSANKSLRVALEAAATAAAAADERLTRERAAAAETAAHDAMEAGSAAAAAAQAPQQQRMTRSYGETFGGSDSGVDEKRMRSGGDPESSGAWAVRKVREQVVHVARRGAVHASLSRPLADACLPLHSQAFSRGDGEVLPKQWRSALRARRGGLV